jgi:hypothetical protein
MRAKHSEPASAWRLIAGATPRGSGFDPQFQRSKLCFGAFISAAQFAHNQITLAVL